LHDGGLAARGLAHRTLTLCGAPPWTLRLLLEPGNLVALAVHALAIGVVVLHLDQALRGPAGLRAARGAEAGARRRTNAGTAPATNRRAQPGA